MRYLLLLLFTAITFLNPAFATSPSSGGASVTVFADLSETRGFPEDVVVMITSDEDADEKEGYVFITESATWGTIGTGSSEVHVFDLDNTLLDVILIEGENDSEEHALVGAAERDGKLYVASTQLGIIEISGSVEAGWTQENYSDGPFWQMYTFLPTIPNGVAFGPDNRLYVSDSLQNLIWAIPDGGGSPDLWFDLGYPVGGEAILGLNGLKFDPERENVYVTYTGGYAIPDRPWEMTQNGHLYRIPFADSAIGVDPEAILTYEPWIRPDGIMFEKHGDLWMTLTGEDAMVKYEDVATDPVEKIRITGSSDTGVPIDQPANFDELNGDLIVTNHALERGLSGDWSAFAVFRVDLAYKVKADPLP